MKAIIALILFVPALCFADIIVILYHKGNDRDKIATVYDCRQIKDAMEFLPANYSHWRIPSGYKVYDDSAKTRWTGKINVSVGAIKTGLLGDSLHVTNPDSIAAYKRRWR